ncbi:MAG: GNAT family N-acetyltransferase [Planctomycetes bacterium]|nr:GNAT family N-acetyltransferase [Planctomycetota bacterium]
MTARERIDPVGKYTIAVARDFLLANYRSHPTFARLYGLADTDTDRTAGIFMGICRRTQRAGMLLACRRGNETLGVLAWSPNRSPDRRLTAFLRVPITYSACWLRDHWNSFRDRRALGEAAFARWRAYSGMAQRAPVHEPTLLICALAVAPAARRSGVARRLLAEVAANPIWSNWAHAIEVNTWDAENVLIYERLGFTVVDHAREGDVDCWTMLRPMRP